MPATATMPVTSFGSTEDIRSHAMNRKREREMKLKWEAHKWFGKAAVPPVKTAGPVRPLKQRTQRSGEKDRIDNQKMIHKTHVQKKRPALGTDEEETTPDSSVDEEATRSKSLVEEEDYKYSFDALRGPLHGDEILSKVLDHAVEKFEDQATTKLVKDEYDVLETHDDELIEREAPGVIVDDDFELI